MKTPLPVDASLDAIRAALARSGNVVVRAEPGAGKTTRVPPALAGDLPAGQQVVVLEPRRLAARMAAARVAFERGEKPGGFVGYQVRFDDVSGPGTRVKFVTEGVLVRQLLARPRLEHVNTVVLDEFHERHIHTDLALGLLRRLQRTSRPDLRLVVMSATLDAAPVARFLGDCPVLDVPGRVFPVDVVHAERPEPVPGGRPLERQVADAVRSVLADTPGGHVLVFLPGAAEIRRAAEACADVARRAQARVLPLHADLSPEEQDDAVSPSDQRKIILATNVAESSVTIDGVVAVVDSGLARIPSHAAWSGMPVLRVARVSRASATQRAGRAGRTGPGRCIRLYTRHDHDTRPEHTPPEIRRLDLAESALLLHGMGVNRLADFPFFEAPEASALQAAEDLLSLLQATDAAGALTDTGRRMLGVALHPRVARVLVEAARRGFPEEGAGIAAILAEGGIAERGTFGSGGAARPGADHACDVLAQLDALERATAAGSLARQAPALGLDVGAAARAARVVKNLSRDARGMAAPPAAGADEDTTLRACILAGFPDRVARRRAQGRVDPHRRDDVEVLLATGGTAWLDHRSAAAALPWIIAIDAEERSGGKQSGVFVRMATAIEPDWLLDVAPQLMTDNVEVEWNAGAERVDAFSRLRFMQLVIEERRVETADHPAIADELARVALARGPTVFADAETLDHLKARVALLAHHQPDFGVRPVDDELLREALRDLCTGRRSLAELRDADLPGALLARAVPPEHHAFFHRELPEAMKLPGGRRCVIHYVAGQPPWVESRLQDFFGMTAAPRVLGGRVPLNLHLNAPNGRAVQITADLAGFWDRHYPAVRKELMRRYPRHLWPEDPRTAAPPPPNRPR